MQVKLLESDNQGTVVPAVYSSAMSSAMTTTTRAQPKCATGAPDRWSGLDEEHECTVRLCKRHRPTPAKPRKKPRYGYSTVRGKQNQRRARMERCSAVSATGICRAAAQSSIGWTASTAGPPYAMFM